MAALKTPTKGLKMKLGFGLMTTVFIFATSLNSLADNCFQQELQFIGRAVQVTRHSLNNTTKQICTYQIGFISSNPSMTCPLSEADIGGTRFNDSNCSLNEGTEISGIIVRRGNTFWIE